MELAANLGVQGISANVIEGLGKSREIVQGAFARGVSALLGLIVAILLGLSGDGLNCLEDFPRPQQRACCFRSSLLLPSPNRSTSSAIVRDCPEMVESANALMMLGPPSLLQSGGPKTFADAKLSMDAEGHRVVRDVSTTAGITTITNTGYEDRRHLLKHEWGISV